MSDKTSILHQRALDLAKNFQRCEAEMISLLQEIETEKIHLRMGFSSLFAYVTESLNFSEYQAYNFINVMRKSREIPQLQKQIEEGRLTVSKARKIVPVLTIENHKEWFHKAETLPKDRLEAEVARVNPELTITESVRKISETKSRVRVDLDDDVVRLLKRAQILAINKKKRNVKLDEIIREVFSEYLDRHDPIEKSKRILTRAAGADSSKELLTDYVKLVPGTSNLNKSLTEQVSKSADTTRSSQLGVAKVISRNIPAHIKHRVLARDGGQCRFKGADGKICGSHLGVELHHLRPWAQGGGHDLSNILLLCSQHHKIRHELGER